MFPSPPPPPLSLSLSLSLSLQGIVVKVLYKKLGDDYYKKKGVITEVKDQFTAIITMLDSGDKIKIDQSYLETVIPAIGRAHFSIQVVPV